MLSSKRLFDIYEPLLKLTTEEFESLIVDKRVNCAICQNLLSRLSKKHLVAYKKSVSGITDTENYKLLEWYHRARLICDYIGGMTDDYTF